MILRSIRIREFKNVTDSGEVPIEDGATCLVGMNESGKSAVLQALYRLNPLPTGHAETFDGLRDYPRRRYAREKDRVAGARPVTATFALEDEDVRAVEAACGEGVLASRLVTVTRTYENERHWSIECCEERCVEADDAGVSREPDDPSVPEEPEAADETGREAVREDDFADESGGVTALYPTGEDAGPPDPEPCDAPVGSVESESCGADLADRVRAVVEDRLPGFLYFDQYSVMAGRVSLSSLQGDGQVLAPGERTALSLMRLAGVAAADFTIDEYEARKAALEAASSQLADEVFEYWSQNRDLSVEFDIDPGPRGGDAGGPSIDVRIRSRRHGISLNFRERSHGFTWFFSFLAAFSELQGRERTILLLDEPGLGLHASGQADLLRFIDERLVCSHQVVYSTHSPFMVAPGSLGRVRTVQDEERDGSRVSTDLLDASPETRLPLEAALGFDLVRAIHVGPRVLVVERPSDLVFLTVMSALLERRGRTRLHPRWTVVPAGGVVGACAAVALLGAGLQGAVVVDLTAGAGDSPLRAMLDPSPGREVPGLCPVVNPRDFSACGGSDLEDLFADEFYLGLVNRSGAAAVERFEIAGEGSIVARIEAVTGTGLNRYLPARLLVESPSAGLPEAMDEETPDRFEALFGAINGLVR